MARLVSIPQRQYNQLAMKAVKTLKRGPGASCLMIGMSTLWLFAGCVTPYQPSSAMGGYLEHNLNQKTFTVSYSGNGYTKHEIVYACLLRRCAELATENQADFFVIEDYDDLKVLLGEKPKFIQVTVTIHKGLTLSNNPAVFEARKVLAQELPGPISRTH